MTLLAALLLFPVPAQEGKGAYYAVPLAGLELEDGSVLPQYGDEPPWRWDDGLDAYPRAVLAGAGEVVYLADDGTPEFWLLGALLVHTDAPRDVQGTLFLPRASGEGSVKLGFRIPAARATAGEADFQAAELQHYQRLLRAELPGGAWFRHRTEELAAELATALGARPNLADPSAFGWQAREPDDLLALFSGGRAVYENLQLERGLPAGDGEGATVPLDTLEGLTVRAFDWKARLEPREAALDTLAWLVPADQHALFFPRFQGLVELLDEAERFGSFGLTAFEGRSSDGDTRARYERQLCLTLDELARTLGPLAIESAALTGSDPYLRSGSDVALLLQVRPEFRAKVEDLIVARQAAAGFLVGASKVGGGSYTRSPTRSVSSHLFAIPTAESALPAGFPAENVLVVTNSAAQSARILAVARGEAAALGASDEYVFFRQRYARGGGGESAFLVLSDAAIRRWCSPRWRIGAARRLHAAAALAEETAGHLTELVTGAAARTLGPAADFPELGALALSPEGVHSSAYGTLTFQTPIAELDFAKVSEREAQLYRAWRDGYQSAWSNFFDPIAASLAITPEETRLDLTVMPLILGTEYADLREATRGPGLGAGGGDEHATALVHFAMGLNPEWEPLRSVGQAFGSAGQKLGADPFSWLGTWLAVYLDDGPFWDELLQAESVDELVGFDERLNEIPLALTIAVQSPLKLAVFLTSLRAFVDGTAPGMTEWKDRIVGERRFVEIGSRGLGDDLSLFYATAPGALILSLREETLLAAMARAEAAEAEAAPGVRPPSGPTAHATFEVRGRGLELIDLLFREELRRTLVRGSFGNLPILNEWRRLFPAVDPVELHARVFHERLLCPGGGAYVWNEEWSTLESSVFGHPGAPKDGVRRPPDWAGIERLRSRLTFEDDGLRVRVELEHE
jgi:hypothetical protein